jgi:hypothetical protein
VKGGWRAHPPPPPNWADFTIMMEFIEKKVAIATPYMNQKSQSTIKNTAHPYSVST